MTVAEKNEVRLSLENRKCSSRSSIAVDAWLKAGTILRNPAFLVLLILANYSWIFRLLFSPRSGDYVNLAVVSREIQTPTLLIAAGAFLALGWMVSKPQRTGTADFEDTLPLPATYRMASYVLVAIFLAVVSACTALAQILVASSHTGAVERIDYAELATAPLCVLLAGLSGVMVGAWKPSSFAVIISLCFLSGLTLLALFAVSSPLRWLSFVAGENPFALPPLPLNLLPRIPGWHALWLLSVGAFCALMALVRVGRRRRVLVMATSSSLILSLFVGAMQLQQANRPFRPEELRVYSAASSMQTCQIFGSVTYCAFPGFSAYIPAWRQVLQAQEGIASQRLGPLLVRQQAALPSSSIPQQLPLEDWYREDARSNMPPSIPVSTRWSAGAVDSPAVEDVFSFSALLSARLVTGEALPGGGQILCGSQGVSSLWLAAAATVDTRDALTTIRAHTTGAGMQTIVLNSSTIISWGPREADLAFRLLSEDRERVRTTLSNNWHFLTDPSTSIEDGARVFGLKPPSDLLQGGNVNCA